LKGLATEQDDTWNLTHLFALAKLYAQQNDSEAKKAIFDRFLNNPIEGSDWVGYSEILEIDGLKGLLFISEKFGKYIEQNPDDYQDDWIVSSFQEKNKNLKVSNELKKLAKSNKYVKIYLDNLKRTKSSQKKYKIEKIDYNDIIEEVFISKPFISFIRKKNLTPEEINQVGKRLLTETNKSNIEKLLDIFDFHKFPFDSDLILNFASQKKSSKNKIVDNAIDALKHLKSKKIREFALDKIQNTKNPISFLEILISNYQDGDFEILSDIVNKTNNEHKIEQLARIYTDIYEANDTKECKKPLEILYSKMNCGIHRNGILNILLKNEVLSEKLKKEIIFDSDLDTREMLNEQKNGS
jgi:hypothetical protein